jgi:hypothetical protein
MWGATTPPHSQVPLLQRRAPCRPAPARRPSRLGAPGAARRSRLLRARRASDAARNEPPHSQVHLLHRCTPCCAASARRPSRLGAPGAARHSRHCGRGARPTPPATSRRTPRYLCFIAAPVLRCLCTPPKST